MAAAVPSSAVQGLNPTHRDDIMRHLLKLPEEGRRLRFGHPIRTDAIRDYLDGIDFARDLVLGVHAPDTALIGVAHLGLDPAEGLAELGLSVDPAYRGNGCGLAMLHQVVLHAANLGYRVLLTSCLAENTSAIHLARKAGLRVVIESGETDAQRPSDRDRVTLVDSTLKQQCLWMARPVRESISSPTWKLAAVDERRRNAVAARVLQGEGSIYLFT
jgi:RimJ/RimL family protein N-acetyltransferase